jgi:hypothetical protein
VGFIRDYQRRSFMLSQVVRFGEYHFNPGIDTMLPEQLSRLIQKFPAVSKHEDGTFGTLCHLGEYVGLASSASHAD